MKTKEELVEAMARAICAAQGLDWKDQFSIYSSNGDPLAHEAYMHDADAALSALRQWLADNWLVVVPRDPSDAMAEAGWSVRGTQFEPTPDAQEIYRAMIAASPDVLGKP